MDIIATMISIRYLALLVGAQLLAPPAAMACTPTLTLFETLPKIAAAKGFLVRARVVRGYDAQKREPEMLEIEKVFVGSKLPRTITLYRDNAFYDARSKGIPDSCGEDFAAAETKARLYLLFPVPPASGARTSTVFELPLFYRIATNQPGLDALLTQAKRLGRLRGRPLPADF